MANETTSTTSTNKNSNEISTSKTDNGITESVKDSGVMTTTKFLLKQSTEPALADVDDLSTSVCPTNQFSTSPTSSQEKENKKEKKENSKQNSESNRDLKTKKAVANQYTRSHSNSQSCPFSSRSSDSTIKTLPNHFQISNLFSQDRISATRVITKSFESAVISQSVSALSPTTAKKGKVFQTHKKEPNNKWWFQKFHWRDLDPQHHITHKFTIQWLWDQLIEQNADKMTKALNDHSMHCYYQPVKLSKRHSEPAIVMSQTTVPPLLSPDTARTTHGKSAKPKIQTKKPSNLRSKSYQQYGASSSSKNSDQLTSVEKSKSQSFGVKVHKLNEWNDQSCLRQIRQISHKPIFLRSQSKCIGDSFLHFLRLMYQTDTTQDETNTTNVVVIRYIRYLYNLHRNYLSGAKSRSDSLNTGDVSDAPNQQPLNFAQRLEQIKNDGPKKPITVTEYRIFVEYVVNAFRTNVPQLNPQSPTYKPSHEALLTSIRYQLEKLSLVFLDELSLPTQEDEKMVRAKTGVSTFKALTTKLTKFATAFSGFQLNASSSDLQL